MFIEFNVLNTDLGVPTGSIAIDHEDIICIEATNEISIKICYLDGCYFSTDSYTLSDLVEKINDFKKLYSD